MGQSTFTSLFNTIPPERIGLAGEYDHKGLAKRVSHVLHQHFEQEEIQDIRVSQRGAVVLLVGEIPNQRLLIKLVNIAMTVEGAVDVEINGVSVAHRLRNYLEVKPSRDALVRLLGLINSK